MSIPPRTPPRFPMALNRLAPTPRVVAADLLRPQAPLQHAADSAARRAAPSGLGLDTLAMRRRMVERLRAEGIHHDAVLQAFLLVERHRFVDSALATQAYEDTSLPIGMQQTISKPSVVARMLSLLFEGELARQQGHLGPTLEIGTGCGYQAALLDVLAQGLVSIERIKPLHDKAHAVLRTLFGASQNKGQNNGNTAIRLLHGDGRLGHSPGAPYHSIVAAAGGGDVPAAWLDQLAVGGRLVAPTVDAARGGQVLLVLDKYPAGVQRRWLDAVHFVPLRSGIE